MKAKEKSLSNLNNNPANKMAESQNTTKGGAVELSNLDNSRVNFGDISDDYEMLVNIHNIIIRPHFKF